MSQENQEVALIPNELAIQKLADTFDETEKRAILRDLFIVTQIKTISVKEDVTDVNGYTKTVTVKKKMDPFRAMAYVMLCRELGFNPALNLVTMLEDNFYIGLDAHILYAQKTGLCHGIDAVLEEEKEIDYEKKEWAKGSKIPTISKGKGKYYRYKCTVKKMVDGQIAEFYGTGIASPDNVTGGDKATDLKIMQMAEARAMRRALKKSFPPGCSHIEDVYEYPDYDGGKLLEEPKEQPENLAQLARAPIEPAKPIEEIKAEVVQKQEEAKKAITEEKSEPLPPVKKTAKENLAEKQEAAYKSVKEDPRFEQAFGKSEEVQEDAPEEIQEDATEEITPEVVDEVFGDIPPEEFATEEEEKAHYRKLIADAKDVFAVAVLDWKKEPTDEKAQKKNDAKKVYDGYLEIVTKRGWIPAN